MYKIMIGSRKSMNARESENGFDRTLEPFGYKYTSSKFLDMMKRPDLNKKISITIGT